MNYKIDVEIKRYINIPLLGHNIRLLYYGGEYEPDLDTALSYLSNHICAIYVWKNVPYVRDEISIYTRGQTSMESIMRLPYTDELKEIVPGNLTDPIEIREALSRLLKVE